MSARRYVSQAVSIRIADVETLPNGRKRWKRGTDEHLLRIAGCWDRRRKRWVKGVKISGLLILRFHRGQEAAARWLADWMRRWQRGDWEGCVRVFVALLIGGRRSGKTHLACAIMIAFAVLSPGAREWAISPTLETGEELDANFCDLIPRRWYKRRQAKTGRATTFRFRNGSAIFLRSAVKPERLKAGRVDLALLNEAQEMSDRALMKLQPATADRGGLLLVAANPPERAIGKWVETLYNAIRGGAADGVAFQLDPRNNPWIIYEALLSLAKVADKKTYERDVLGLFPPIGDTVFHAWSAWNLADPTPELVDITVEVSQRALGRGAGDLVGMDFQRLPAMVGVVMRVFRDRAGLELLWVVDEAVVEETDEDGLVDELESIPRWQVGDGAPRARDMSRECYRGWSEPDDSKVSPTHAAVVMDASGFFQDGEHKINRTSEKWLRARAWSSLYMPTRDSDRNPPIVERMRTGNALLENQAGARRLFVARHCTKTAEALREYENKNGVPNRRSKHAHIVDAVTYVAYRLYGVPRVPRKHKSEYRSVGKRTRAEELRGW